MREIEIRPRWITPMKPRSPDEAHRAATPLELFFDLVFVVAVAQAASGLHHGIAEGHVVDALVNYVIVFFGIWWAWMNFTWFASAYDNGDMAYRLVVFVQMTGALIMSSGLERFFAYQDATLTMIGYVVMRVAQVTQNLRAAQSDPAHRPALLRYALGFSLAQLGWITTLFLPIPSYIPALLGGIVELLIPVWAERAAPTPWHADHIRERYGLFTIIVLGESIFSTSVAIQSAIDEGPINGGLIPVIIGGLLIAFTMWWLYFYQPADYLMDSLRDAFIWTYAHLLIFGATAAVGAGLAVVIDQVTQHAEISGVGAGMTVVLPVSIYVLSLWILHEQPRAKNVIDKLLHPVIVVLVLLTPFTGQAVLLTGILLVILIAIRQVRHLDTPQEATTR